MGSIQRRDSLDSDDDDYPLYSPHDFLEARTLTSKELQLAREEALHVLKTNSPEEAFKIFTQGLKYNVESPLPGTGGAAPGVEPAKPPAAETPAPPPQN